MSRKIRKLDAGETAAFDALYDWLEGCTPELPNTAYGRLRVFFQDNPVSDLRLEEDCES